MKTLLISAAGIAFLAGCSQMAPAPVAKVKDGDVLTPANYRSWPNKVLDVQRADVKQVRDMWISTSSGKFDGAGAAPNGSVSVMELYKARENPDGTPVKDASGRMVKGELLKVFVMGKGEGWGTLAPAGLQNGDWSYAAYGPDGKTPSNDALNNCRTCHLKVQAKDFLFRQGDWAK